MLARDIRACPPASAHYTCWLDDRGFVIEDGVILHPKRDDYLLTSAEPNFAYFADRIGRMDVRLEEVSDEIGTLALQGPRSRDLLEELVPQMEHIPYFGVATGEIGGAEVTVSRTGFSGDLGYEIWIDAPDALHVWDTLWESVQGYGVQPFGLAALHMLRIEAGLLLLEADFDSSRYAWNDAHRSTPHRTRLELDVRATSRATTGRSSADAPWNARSPTRRRAGPCAAWSSTGRTTTGSTARPGSSRPRTTRRSSRTGWSTTTATRTRSAMRRASCTRPCSSATSRSPGSAPTSPELGTRVKLEFTVDHHYEQVAAQVARLPLFNPERKTA